MLSPSRRAFVLAVLRTSRKTVAISSAPPEGLASSLLGWWRAFATFALFSSLAIFGQAVSGNIAGTVLDSTGAPVPDAAITITDLDRGAVYNLKSSGDGNFSQTHLL